MRRRAGSTRRARRAPRRRATACCERRAHRRRRLDRDDRLRVRQQHARELAGARCEVGDVADIVDAGEQQRRQDGLDRVRRSRPLVRALRAVERRLRRSGARCGHRMERRWQARTRQSPRVQRVCKPNVRYVLRMSPVSLTLSDDQRDLQELARDFAAREIRPIAAEVDEADDGRVPVGPVGEGDRGRPDLLHAARPSSAAAASHELPDRVRDPGGAELRRRRARLARHLGRLLRRTRARARQRRAAARAS